MSVPSSGELKLYGDIWNSFNSPSQGQNSLHSASIYAGFSTPDAMSDFYGFVDAVAPTVTTSAASGVGTSNFTANGNVTSDGGGAITERGFYFGTNSSSPTNNTKYTVSGTTGAFSRSFTGLSYATYYYWAFATNVAGTTYGSMVSQAPTLVTPGTFYTAVMTRTTCVGSQYHQWYSPQSGGFVTNASLGFGCPYSNVGVGWSFAAGYQDRFLQSQQYPNSNNAQVQSFQSSFTSISFQGGGTTTGNSNRIALRENGSATHYTSDIRFKTNITYL